MQWPHKEKESVTALNLHRATFSSQCQQARMPTYEAHYSTHWDDEQSIKILQNIRSAMNENGKVLIVEMVVPTGNVPSPSKALDLLMLVMEGGKERTEEEYKRLLEPSAFRLTRVIPTKSPYSVIEGERA